MRRHAARLTRAGRAGGSRTQAPRCTTIWRQVYQEMQRQYTSAKLCPYRRGPNFSRLRSSICESQSTRSPGRACTQGKHARAPAAPAALYASSFHSQQIPRAPPQWHAVSIKRMPARTAFLRCKPCYIATLLPKAQLPPPARPLQLEKLRRDCTARTAAP